MLLGCVGLYQGQNLHKVHKKFLKILKVGKKFDQLEKITTLGQRLHSFLISIRYPDEGALKEFVGCLQPKLPILIGRHR